MIYTARRQLRANPKRYKDGEATYCYRAVKDALRASFLIGEGDFGGAYARQGVNDLAQFGFRNLLDDRELYIILKNNPFMAPKGAILVYKVKVLKNARPNINPAGHIEIKTEDSGLDGYISISEEKRSAYGLHPTYLELIGVLIK